MQPGQVTFGQYSSGNVQLVIPRYQRPYEWGVDRWVDLWRDISTSYRSLEESIKLKQPVGAPHFMGPLILEDDGAHPGGVAIRRLVVDGQQRLLTLFVIQAAIRDHDAYLRGTIVASDNELAAIHPKFGGPVLDRVELEKSYRGVYDAIATGECLNEIPLQYAGDPLAQAYRFFRYQLWQGRPALENYDPSDAPKPSRKKDAPHAGSFDLWGSAETANAIDLGTLEAVLATRLKMLEITLDVTDEQSSVIFETMNSKSTPLRQFDHLRNSVYVCMPTRRDKFHASHWRAVEETLDGISYSSLRSSSEEQYFYEYMISLGEVRINFKDLHRSFMERVYRDLGYPPRDEKKFESHYAVPFAETALLYPIALGQATSATVFKNSFKVSPACQAVISELLLMSGGPPIPIVIRLLRGKYQGNITDAELLAGLRDIQSYLVRIMLQGRKLSPLRSVFMQISRNMGTTTSLSSLRAALRKADWPANTHVLGTVTKTELYSYGGAQMFPILRGIERQLSSRGAHKLPYGSNVDDYSIEHIFPQSDSVGAAWTLDLKKWGSAAPLMAMKERRHTLGNLTAVTKYDNSKNGRKSFGEKQALIKKVAPIRLNESLTAKSRWTKSVIDARSRLLAEAALKEWPRH